MRKSRLLAIAIDAADSLLVERWMTDGYLPNLSRLAEQGSYVPLRNMEIYQSETPWTNFLTGCLPETSGYWGMLTYDPETYTATESGANDFKDIAPFYALGDKAKVAVMDMPHSRPHVDVNGKQLIGWGAHSPQAPSESIPADWLADVRERIGCHPTLMRDHRNCYDREELAVLKQEFMQGLDMREQLFMETYQSDDWDLFLCAIGETHPAGHSLWHLGLDYPLNDSDESEQGVRDIYIRSDELIGKLMDDADDSTTIAVFSIHGMQANVMDVSSMLLLPESMYRWAFPGEMALGDPDKFYQDGLDYNFPLHWKYEMWRRLSDKAGHKLESPDEQIARQDLLDWMPANWYRTVWSQMSAFALPSYSDGYIRINLEGRERDGMISAEQYDDYCDQLASQVSQLKDGRSGQSVVKNIVRTRTSKQLGQSGLPDADLIVQWNDQQPFDSVRDENAGLIGPVPYFRTGGHRPYGFALFSGQSIPQGQRLPETHAINLTATLLDLMGQPVPEYMDGVPIEFIRKSSAVA